MKIQMFVAGIGLEEKSGLPVVVLNDAEKKQALPILVGIPEAKAISKALQHISSKRPSTHELLMEVISGFGYELDHVCIDNAIDDTYYGKLSLVPESSEKSDASIEVDARPSDALVVAIMREVPIYVTEEILQSSAIRMELLDAPDGEDKQKFKEFVKDINASDFNRYGNGPVELPE